MAFDANQGINKLARVLSTRIKEENKSPLFLDFGEIQPNGSLVTNTFPVAIPKGQYSVCRQLTLGEEGSILTKTGIIGTQNQNDDDNREHSDNVENDYNADEHQHNVLIPENMRGIAAGDRVLVAWVQSEAVVIDIIKKS